MNQAFVEGYSRPLQAAALDHLIFSNQSGAVKPCLCGVVRSLASLGSKNRQKLESAKNSELALAREGNLQIRELSKGW